MGTDGKINHELEKFLSFETIKELIVCPECSTTQEAEVVLTIPWPSFVHHCEKCKYVIMESEWNRVNK